MNRRIKLVAESVRCYGARVLTLDAAEGLLTPYKKSIFIEPIREAVDCWHEFVEESPSKALAMDATARANMIHCWWVQNVRSQLEVEIGIREIEALQFFAVVIEKAPIVRFKLLSSGRSGNVATDQQKLLGMQQYKEEVADAMTLEGIPNPPAILTCGYTLDDLIAIREVEIRYEYDGWVEWRWVLWNDSEGGTGSFEQLPFPNFPTPRPAVVRSTRNQEASPDAGDKTQGTP